MPNPGTSGALPTYGHSIADWRTKFVHLPGDSVPSEDGNQGFRTTDGTLGLAAGESGLWLIYARTEDYGTAGQLFVASSAGDRIVYLSTGGIQTVHNNISAPASGFTDHNWSTTGKAHAFGWYRRADINQSGTTTDLVEIVGTHHEGDRTGITLVKALGGVGDGSPLVYYNWAAFWKGANAEVLTVKQILERLEWPLAY